VTTEDDLPEPPKKKRKRKKRWFVLRGRVERGPYTREELREAFVLGTLTGTSRVRLEGDDHVAPLSEVLGMGQTYEGPVADADDEDEDEDAASAEDEPAPRKRKRRGPRAAADPENPYAPPAEDDEEGAGPADSWRPSEPPGNFALGLAIGFFCGCIGLVYSFWAPSGTRRGIWVGVGGQFVFGVMLEVCGITRGGR